jgi:hypothetical protein
MIIVLSEIPASLDFSSSEGGWGSRVREGGEVSCKGLLMLSLLFSVFAAGEEYNLGEILCFIFRYLSRSSDRCWVGVDILAFNSTPSLLWRLGVLFRTVLMSLMNDVVVACWLSLGL